MHNGDVSKIFLILISTLKMETTGIVLLFGWCMRVVFSSQLLIELDQVALDSDCLDCRIRDRANASKAKSVWMLPREYIIIDFCLSKAQNFSIQNVEYSNDGGGDVLTVSLDGSVIGQITSMVRYDGGRAWNQFIDSGQIGEYRILEPGKHTILLNLTVSDRFGIELDRLVIDFDGNVTADDIQCGTSKELWGGNSFLGKTCKPPEIWPVGKGALTATESPVSSIKEDPTTSGQIDQISLSSPTTTQSDTSSTSVSTPPPTPSSEQTTNADSSASSANTYPSHKTITPSPQPTTSDLPLSFPTIPSPATSESTAPPLFTIIDRATVSVTPEPQAESPVSSIKEDPTTSGQLDQISLSSPTTTQSNTSSTSVSTPPPTPSSEQTTNADSSASSANTYSSHKTITPSPQPTTTDPPLSSPTTPSPATSESTAPPLFTIIDPATSPTTVSVTPEPQAGDTTTTTRFLYSIGAGPAGPTSTKNDVLTSDDDESGLSSSEEDNEPSKTGTKICPRSSAIVVSGLVNKLSNFMLICMGFIVTSCC